MLLKLCIRNDIMILHEPQMIAEGIWSTAGMMTDNRTPKYMKKNLFQCHYVPHHLKSRIYCPHIKLDFGNEKPEAYLTNSQRSIYLYICVKLSSLPQFLKMNFPVSSFDCIAWSVIIGKNVDGIVCDILGEVPFRQLPAETEQNHEGSETAHPVYVLRFEPGTSQM